MSTSDRKKAEVATRGRATPEQLFELSARLTLRLLGNDELDDVIQQALEGLGQGTGVDRVYLFETRIDPDSGHMLGYQRYEWAAEGIAAEIDNPELQGLDFDEVLPRHRRCLEAGESLRVVVRDIPDQSERELMRSQGILSLMVVPVMLRGSLWGFLGFDAVRVERHWSDDDERILRIVAASLGAAIDRRRNEAEARQARAVFEAARDAIIVTDPDGLIVAVNPSVLRLTGYGSEELIGQPSRMLDTRRENEAFYEAVWTALREQGHWHGENWIRRKDGGEYPQWLSISAVTDKHGRATHYVAAGTDISRLKNTEAQLQFLAEHDVLTELPNRRRVTGQLELAIDRARLREGRAGVLFVDLDRFKSINDSLGHAIGDSVLKEVALRMRDRLRGEDTLARLGGDEFVVVLASLGEPEEANIVARGLLNRLREPIQIGERDIYVGASIGISHFPEHGDSAEELLRFADVAMYEAKLAGRDQIHVFTPTMKSDALGQLDLESKMRRAVEAGHMQLHYQPRVCIATGRVVGAEALLRVDDEAGGYLPTDRIIPLAERSGLINRIGRWVIEEACRQMQRWEHAGQRGLIVSVNVSARQFYLGDLGDIVAEARSRWPAKHSSLELEITETVLMDRPEVAIEQLGALRRAGLRISLDDFGTGYCSLAYLTRFPIDSLKIDARFVADLPDDHRAATIARSVIALGQQLELTIVAEGVETPGQLEFLRQQGCADMQGYVFSPAVPADQWLEVARKRLVGSPESP